MKCPACGYVSLDDVTHCKSCGAETGNASSPSRWGTHETGAPLEPPVPGDLLSLSLEESDPVPDDREDLLTMSEVLSPAPGARGGSAAEMEPGLPEPAPGAGASPAAEEEEFELSEEAVPRAPELPKEEVEAHRSGEEFLSIPDLDISTDAGESTLAEPPGPEGTAGFSLAGDMGSGKAGFDRGGEALSMLWAEDQGAGIWRRAAAIGVDQLIITATLALFWGGASLSLSLAGVEWSRQSSPEGLAAAFLPFYLLGLGLSMGYFTFFPGWRGSTVGKMLFRLEVSRLDGERMSYSRSFLRWVGYLVSVTFAGLGFAWILLDEKRRGWHDYLSGTRVKEVPG